MGKQSKGFQHRYSRKSFYICKPVSIQQVLDQMPLWIDTNSRYEMSHHSLHIWAVSRWFSYKISIVSKDKNIVRLIDSMFFKLIGANHVKPFLA